MVSNIFNFHPYLGEWSNLTNIFEMGWNHQLVIDVKSLLFCWGGGVQGLVARGIVWHLAMTLWWLVVICGARIWVRNARNVTKRWPGRWKSSNRSPALSVKEKTPFNLQWMAGGWDFPWEKNISSWFFFGVAEVFLFLINKDYHRFKLVQ